MTPAQQLEQIISQIPYNTSNPHWLAENRVLLAGLYSYFSGQLEKLIFSKPAKWLELRKECKSDNATTKMWQMTEDGQKEEIYELRMKKIDKLMSSMNSMIRVLENEARNIS